MTGEFREPASPVPDWAGIFLVSEKPSPGPEQLSESVLRFGCLKTQTRQRFLPHIARLKKKFFSKAVTFILSWLQI